MDKSKSYCEFCKVSIPSSYMHKHQTSERHLRAKAAKMFYKSKTSNKHPQKRSKYDDSFLLNTNLSEMINSQESLQVSSISSQVKGVWILVHDRCTGRIQYKNRLSGKIQSNKPLGLRDEDLQHEEYDSVVVDDYEKIQPMPQEEFEEKEIGKWVDVNNSYWFGGDDAKSSEDDTGNIEKKSEIYQELEENENSKNNSEEEKQKINCFRGKGEDNFMQEGENQKFDDLNITERLKAQLENNDIEEEIIDKPAYKKEINSSLVFRKRPKTKQIYLP